MEQQSEAKYVVTYENGDTVECAALSADMLRKAARVTVVDEDGEEVVVKESPSLRGGA